MDGDAMPVEAASQCAIGDNSPMTTPLAHDPLVIAGKPYRSRLLTGTGKFKDLEETRLATEAAGAEIVTVAIRRTNIGQDKGQPNLLDVLPPDRYTILPNTAGCFSADDAVRTCRLARELLDGAQRWSSWKCWPTSAHAVSRTWWRPSRPPTSWSSDGFQVMVYTNDDPLCASANWPGARLRGGDAAGGADRLRPRHPATLTTSSTIIEREGADPGRCRRRHRLGCRDGDGTRLRWRADEHRHRRRAEPGADGASAMKLAIEAGREAFLAGRIPRKRFASMRRRRSMD
jgi:thiazole synthase